MTAQFWTGVAKTPNTENSRGTAAMASMAGGQYPSPTPRWGPKTALRTLTLCLLPTWMEAAMYPFLRWQSLKAPLAQTQYRSLGTTALASTSETRTVIPSTEQRAGPE